MGKKEIRKRGREREEGNRKHGRGGRRGKNLLQGLEGGRPPLSGVVD